MSGPEVDVVIAVHSPERPVERAARSVLEGTDADVRVTVVCHGTPEEGIGRRLGRLAEDPRLRLVRHVDGIASPSGPFNAGLDLADAPFTSIMGSDDELGPGAVDGWLRVQRRDRADVVLPRLEYTSGRRVGSPPVRPFRSRRLDGVRDRLAYRSAPLGLVSRSRFGHLRLTPGMRNGGDLAYVGRLWYSGAAISFARDAPPYVIHDDASDRVTLAPKPVARELAWLDDLADAEWFAALPADARRALAVKFARVHVLGAATSRAVAGSIADDDRAALVHAVRVIAAIDPAFVRSLSSADAALVRDLLADAASAERIVAAGRARRVPRRIADFTTSSPLDLLRRDAPVRLTVGSVLVSRIPTRTAGRR
ncbi:glycosyltransferase family 2 protein [Agromyces sp. ZXT2-6]|uniref:glycosyltransferase family 2 protein n=1 Tax=Agromyces sp. ZXT2-6 TaxID=3461153 RepID=UPI0040552695